MSKDWKEVTDDDLPNVAGNQSAEVITRYQRIMDKKTINALMQVWMGLFDVKKSMQIASEKLEARLRESEAIQKEAATSQGKLQRVASCIQHKHASTSVWITPGIGWTCFFVYTHIQ